MSETVWHWTGAKWWKFDFHAHTPASADYGKGPQQGEFMERSPRECLLDYMRAGIDCVAVTDHDSGAWIDRLKTALVGLEQEKPTGFRPLWLFPGVELSVTGGVHVLAIFDQSKSTADVDALKGAVGLPGSQTGGAVTTKSFVEVIDAITRADGIAIPAHVDGAKGLFELQGTTLSQALESPGIFAMEVTDSGSARPSVYRAKRLQWTEVLGSDCHHPTGTAGQRFPGSHYTWIKMGRPTLGGLRLALLDGSMSVRRSDQPGGDPNSHAPLLLESVRVADAHYIGRGSPFTLELNPWLNAIIGGRGSGKSTLVEFLRIAMRREDEVPAELESEFSKYKDVNQNRDSSGLQTRTTQIIVTYRKDGARFHIQWSQGGELDSILAERTDGTWAGSEGDIRQRFPVRIYSQKQIFQLSKAPLALLQIIDDAPEVGKRSWQEQWKEEESRFLSLRAKGRELEPGLTEEARLRGELDDVKRKLAVFETAGHAGVLKNFQQRHRQQHVVEAWEKSWADTGERVREIAREIVPEPLDAAVIDLESPQDLALWGHANAARESIEKIQVALESLATGVEEAVTSWKAARDSSEWKRQVDTAIHAYDSLKAKLVAEGAGDPAAYGEFVQRRQAIEQRLKDLADRKLQVDEIKLQAEASLERLTKLRQDLTELRQRFLQTVLEDNRYVRIATVPYGATQTVEADFRRLIQRERGFERDIGLPGGNGLLGRLYSAGTDPTSFKAALTALKAALRAIAAGHSDGVSVHDRRFAEHMAGLRPEALDRVDLWFPEDSLELKYVARNGQFRPIEEGSPGQKTAALLAFLLSYGEEPLILDQPEDDLDNHLIYDLIVRQLREEVKPRRQVLVVTHNANIVVNGDAELVVALEPRGGQTQRECTGSLQERSVRDTICSIMEGGREAFEQRYRRIILETRDV